MEEKVKLSEWSRTLDKITRMNEAEALCMNVLISIEEAGNYPLLDTFLSACEMCFMLFQDTCTKEEVGNFYSMRDECRKIRDRIMNEANAWRMTGQEAIRGPYRIKRADADAMRDLMRLLFKLQHRHGLGIRTHARMSFSEQVKNVFAEG